jgi:hypothetical protein
MRVARSGNITNRMLWPDSISSDQLRSPQVGKSLAKVFVLGARPWGRSSRREDARARESTEGLSRGTARASCESSAELVDVGADGVVRVLRVGVAECLANLAGGPAEDRNRPLK